MITFPLQYSLPSKSPGNLRKELSVPNRRSLNLSLYLLLNVRACAAAFRRRDMRMWWKVSYVEDDEVEKYSEVEHPPDGGSLRGATQHFPYKDFRSAQLSRSQLGLTERNAG